MSRYLALVLPVCLLVALVGCAPSKGDIEKSIKDEIKTGLGVQITNVELNKQPDGGYTGTATATNGDTYDITVKPSSRGKAEWEAVASQATVERKLRDHLKNAFQADTTKMELKKEADGSYNGIATVTNGDTYEVTSSSPRTEGGTMNAVAAQGTVERLIREDIEKSAKVKVKSFDITRQAPGTFSGTATLANGRKYKVSTRMEGNNLHWEYAPLK